MTAQFDIGIIGSGFSGALLAWILARQGQSVVMVDRTAHPRFVIGESSTPLADFLLEQIAGKYGLDQLRPLSRWGSWQRELPHLRAGKKRGFSYYYHRRGQRFHETAMHDHSLLVAASANDELSDTHWMRSDVDQWFCQQAVAAGVLLFEGFAASQLQVTSTGWRIEGYQVEQPLAFEVQSLIDASGQGSLLAQALGLANLNDQLMTRTASVFGHFRQVGSMSQWLVENGLPCEDDPFNADDAAQHHWLGDGWIWMLRFSEGTTSVGLTLPCQHIPTAFSDPRQRFEQWKQFLHAYPTVAELMASAQLVNPLDNEGQPQLQYLPRISRLWSRAAGENWLMLPSTVGLIDPLHSTGIGHALSGVLRAADIFTCPQARQRAELIARYAEDVVSEIRWIDRLVHNCYVAGQRSFADFVAACSLYFIAAIHCERQLAETQSLPSGFLWARHSPVQSIVMRATAQLAMPVSDSMCFGNWLREQIEPWNDVGLLDDSLRNRLHRSAAPKSF